MISKDFSLAGLPRMYCPDLGSSESLSSAPDSAYCLAQKDEFMQGEIKVKRKSKKPKDSNAKDFFTKFYTSSRRFFIFGFLLLSSQLSSS
jgi:hypothetical protein